MFENSLGPLASLPGNSDLGSDNKQTRRNLAGVVISLGMAKAADLAYTRSLAMAVREPLLYHTRISLKSKPCTQKLLGRTQHHSSLVGNPDATWIPYHSESHSSRKLNQTTHRNISITKSIVQNSFGPLNSTAEKLRSRPPNLQKASKLLYSSDAVTPSVLFRGAVKRDQGEMMHMCLQGVLCNHDKEAD